MSVRTGALRLLRWIVAILIGLLLLPYVLVLFYLAVPPVSTLLLWRWVTGARGQRDRGCRRSVRGAGRLHHHAADGENPVPVAGAQLRAQGAGISPRAVD